jgi:hypothetical protein
MILPVVLRHQATAVRPSVNDGTARDSSDSRASTRRQAELAAHGDHVERGDEALMRHRASRKFWQFYRRLTEAIRHVADENYVVLKQDPKHPSLHFKKAGRFWSVRVGAS